MKPISNEKRHLIVSAKERKEKIKVIAQWLEVSERVIKQIWHQYKTTGSIEPKVYPGRPSSLTNEMEASIRLKIKQEPDATLSNILVDLDLPIKKTQLSNWLIKNGYGLKKNSSCKQCPKTRCCRKTSRVGR